nr:hypothetical protein [Tanacetum cinerariifolium]
NEGTGSKPGVLDASTVVSATLSEGTGAKPGVPNKDKDITKEKVILEWGDEQESEFFDDDNDDVEKDDKDNDTDDEGDDHVSDTQNADDEDDETESDEDESYKYKIRVCKDEDVEMKDAEGEESNKGEEKVIEIVTETPVSTAVPSPHLKHIFSSVQQTPTPILTPPFTTDALCVTTVVPESNALTAVELRVAKLEKDMSELKTVIPPKKSRGKGSKGRKTVDDSQETVDVSKESAHEPKPAKKKSLSKRRIKKKVTLLANDNIISDDPDAALELAKSINQIKAEEAEATRKVHATHAKIMTKSVPEFAKKKSSERSSKSVVKQDTLSAPKSEPATSKTKLKGAPSLTPQEQEVADIMQALKESKKTSRRKPGTEGSNEGTGSKPGVLDASTVVSATPSEGTGAKPGVPNKDKDITKEKVILEWGDEQESEFFDDDNVDVEKDDKDNDTDDEGDDHVSDTQNADDEDDETESDEDESYKYKIRVRKDEDVEMKDAEGEESDKEIVTETPVSTAVPSPHLKPIFSSVQQTPTPILTPPFTTDALSVTTVVPESNALTAVELRVAKLEKDMSELKT